MRKIYLVAFLFSFLNCVHGQSAKYNLKHLTKENYVRQIEQCLDSASSAAGDSGKQWSYDGYAYDWLVGQIDEVINKHFHNTITRENARWEDIVYSLVWRHNKKDVVIGLTFLLKEKAIGKTDVLYFKVNGDSVETIIKIFSSKKDITKIFKGAVVE